MTKPVLVNFVLDRSGSMGRLRQSSIDGFNQFLREQKAQDGECRMSLTMFNTTFDVRYVAGDIHHIPELSWFDYVPDGGTALLDAVGTTIKGAEAWIAGHRHSTVYTMGGINPQGFDTPIDWKVIVVVLTDGEENSSQQWHINQPMIPGDAYDLNGLIQWKQNEGWDFLFLGAGGSKWLEQTFGTVVPRENLIGYAHDAYSHGRTYSGVSNTISTARTTGDVTWNPKD